MMQGSIKSCGKVAKCAPLKFFVEIVHTLLLFLVVDASRSVSFVLGAEIPCCFCPLKPSAYLPLVERPRLSLAMLESALGSFIAFESK